MRWLVPLLLLVWAPFGLAQDVVPDTTSPTRYFPLAVGNEWHYVRYGEFFDESYWGTDYQYQRLRVIETLEIGEHEYAIRVRERASVPVPSWYEVGRDTVRFDEDRAVVVQLVGGEDVPRSCPLDGDFGAVVECEDSGNTRLVTVGGGAQQTEELSSVWSGDRVTTAMKSFVPSDASLAYPLYAAGIGYLGQRNDPYERDWRGEDDFDLFHARIVDGDTVRTYGFPEVQSRAVDPTPPELYYPLTEGFAREDLWRVASDERWTRTEVRGDSVVDGQTYSVVWKSVVATELGVDGPEDWGVGVIELVRYDAASGYVQVVDSTGMERRGWHRFGADYGELVEAGDPASMLPDGRRGDYVAYGGEGSRPVLGYEPEATKGFLSVPYSLIADIGYPGPFAARVGQMPQSFAFCTPPICEDRITYLRVVNPDGSLSEFGEPAPVSSFASPPARALAVRAFPNPSVGPIMVALDVPTTGTIELATFDALGRRIWHRELAMSTARQRVEIDASAWAPGLYVVRALAGDASATTTFVRR